MRTVLKVQSISPSRTTFTITPPQAFKHVTLVGSRKSSPYSISHGTFPRLSTNDPILPIRRVLVSCGTGMDLLDDDPVCDLLITVEKTPQIDQAFRTFGEAFFSSECEEREPILYLTVSFCRWTDFVVQQS
jgi:hypothetical protein